MDFTVSSKADTRLRQVLKPGERLRISVLGGGCSGFQYRFVADEVKNADDKLFGETGAQVVIDETSLGLLADAQLDFNDDLMGAAFTIVNPNAHVTLRLREFLFRLISQRRTTYLSV